MTQQFDTDDPQVRLASLGAGLNAAVIGASGGIGSALCDLLAHAKTVDQVFRLSRRMTQAPEGKERSLCLDLEDEGSIAAAAEEIQRSCGALHLVIVASGRLHGGDRLQPEKTWRTLSGPSLERLFRINTVGPALVAKHFLPCLDRERKAVFAALSARVGSIEDNRLGGWHAYRASKAALNMMIKTLSIELARRNPTAVCAGLHPGTVDTPLSKPFQGGVAEDKLFPPDHAARALLSVIDRLTPADTGGLFAWDGSRIPY